VYNITFYNMSVISWRTVLLVEQAPDIPQIIGILYHLKLYRVHLAIRGIRTVSGTSSCSLLRIRENKYEYFVFYFEIVNIKKTAAREEYAVPVSYEIPSLTYF
jgi:hypothetical protein